MQLIFSRKTLAALVFAPLANTFAWISREKSVVSAAQARDRDSFERLMKSHQRPLQKFISSRVNAASRDDVLQETWVAAWEALPAIENPLRIRPWLFSVCYHKIQDHWRRELLVPKAGISGELDSAMTYLPTEYGAVEIRESLVDFWNECSDDQRDVLRMYYRDELTLKEISEILGRNINTVKYQFYRAHSAAREKLAQGQESGDWVRK